MLQLDKKPYYVPKVFEDYRLQANDEIYCTILTSDTELASTFNGIISLIEDGRSSQTSYRVYDNGNISIPFFGDIKVIGMTLFEAEAEIQRVMKRSTPDAQVRVVLRNNMYYVVSGFKNGVFGIYKDNMTIYQALAMSGNPSEVVDFSKIKIVRTDKDGKSIIKEFDLRTEYVIESEFYYIKPNDVIYYTTSNSSFFRVRSFTSLVTTIITPLTFMISMFAFDIK